MLKKARQFKALNRQQQITFVQAWFMLGWMRAAILLTSFKRLSSPMAHHREVPVAKTLNPEAQAEAAAIGKVVAM
ncbi:MAG: hypothetical protein V7754_20100, partial [Halioglobus sp.]